MVGALALTRILRSQLFGVAAKEKLRTLKISVDTLTLTASGFSAFTHRDFAGLTASGELRLTGPVVGAALTGRLVVDAGFLAFADLEGLRGINEDRGHAAGDGALRHCAAVLRRTLYCTPTWIANQCQRSRRRHRGVHPLVRGIRIGWHRQAAACPWTKRYLYRHG